MHHRSFAALAALALLAAPLPAAAQEQASRIGYVNSVAILEEAPGAAEAQALFDEEMQASQEELQRMDADLQNRAADLERQALTLSAEARAAREQQLQALQQEYAGRLRDMQTSADQRRAELVQPIMDRITEVIEAIREEGGYALILDTAAGSIISADPSLDLTQQVLDRLQEPPPGDAGGEVRPDGAGSGA